MHNEVGSKCLLVLIDNVPEEDGQATALVHANASEYLHRSEISQPLVACIAIHDLSSHSRSGCQLLMNLAKDELFDLVQKMTTVASLAMNTVSGRNVRVVYPMSVPLVARLLSLVLTCSGGGDDQAGDWMTGAERRCIDEYALAVKGKNAYSVLVYATLPKDCGGARLDSMVYRLGRETLIGGVPAYARNRRVQGFNLPSR